MNKLSFAAFLPKCLEPSELGVEISIQVSHVGCRDLCVTNYLSGCTSARTAEKSRAGSQTKPNSSLNTASCNAPENVWSQNAADQKQEEKTGGG